METPAATGHLGEATQRIAQRTLVILENRLQLLLVEVQEEREQVLLAIWLALGAAAFGLLAGVALTVVIAVALWAHSPVIAMLVLTVIYGVAAVACFSRLVRLQRDWQTLPGTLEQLKKDRACLEKTFN
jgi:uncharacterized membrane protein YqjE